MATEILPLSANDSIITSFVIAAATGFKHFASTTQFETVLSPCHRLSPPVTGHIGCAAVGLKVFVTVSPVPPARKRVLAGCVTW